MPEKTVEQIDAELEKEFISAGAIGFINKQNFSKNIVEIKLKTLGL